MKQTIYYSKWPVIFLSAGYVFGIILNHTFNPFHFNYWTSMGLSIYWLVFTTLSFIWRGVNSEYNQGSNINKIRKLELNGREIEDVKFGLVLAMKQLDLNTNNNADLILSDRLEALVTRLDRLV